MERSTVELLRVYLVVEFTPLLTLRHVLEFSQPAAPEWGDGELSYSTGSRERSQVGDNLAVQ